MVLSPTRCTQGGEGAGARPAKGDREMEMELTFAGGLEDLGARLLSRKQEREARKKDTVWEAYERRRRCCSDLIPIELCVAVILSLWRQFAR